MIAAVARSNFRLQEENMADQGQNEFEKIDSSVSKTEQETTALTRRTFMGGLASAPLSASVVQAATNPTDPSLMSGAQLVSAYRDRSLSPPDVVSAIFKRISDVGRSVNAFVVTDEEGAIRQAQASAARWKSGNPLGPLDGMPVTIKDNIPVAGLLASDHWGSNRAWQNMHARVWVESGGRQSPDRHHA
jgi:hypothetical protein